MTRAVLFGVGETARLIARYATEKGVQLVGAYSRTSGVGEDIGVYLGLRKGVGRVISADPARDLPGLAADIAFVATQSTLESQIAPVTLCLRQGLDVLSLAEEGFYPTKATRPAARQLDELAKASGKTVFFGGVQDVFWFEALLALTGAAHTVDEIIGYSVSNLEDLGAATLAEYPLGLDSEEFEATVAVGDGGHGGEFFAMESALEAVLARLGVDVIERETHLEPILADEAIVCEALGATFPVGTTCGVSEVVTAKTAQGFAVRAEFQSVLFTEGQEPLVKWTIRGEPELEAVFDHFPGYEVTASNLVNRVPDVIAAEPGYRTVLDLPAPRWWAGAA